jgi:mercuric reductase
VYRCEEPVAVALENIGAKNIQASFRRGEAVFELPEILGLKVQKRQLMKQNINLEK